MKSPSHFRGKKEKIESQVERERIQKMRDILSDDQLKGNTVESKKKLRPSFIANPH